MKLALALTAGTAAAFVAPSSAPAAKTQLAAAPVQKWAGAGPFGFFDPLGLSKDVDAGRLAFYREAEIKHGRVAMLAAVGFLFQEHYTFTGIDSPSYVSFEQPGLAGGVWLALAVMLGNVEYKSVDTFMKVEDGVQGLSRYASEESRAPLFRIKEDHFPGDIGFDPLGLKPTNAKELKEIQSKEINNGRLAMIGIAGMVAQELVNGMKI